MVSRLKVFVGTWLYRCGLLRRATLFRWEMDLALGTKERPYSDGDDVR